MAVISACTYDCPDCCSLLVERRMDGSVSVRGNPDHPFTQGFCCAKGKALPRRLASTERLTTPLLRQGNGFRAIGWDEALGLCAERIQARRHEPDSMLHIKGHGYRGTLAKASGRLFGRLGASQTYGSMCDDTGIEASLRDFGELNHNDPLDLLDARRIVNWGKDLSRSSLHTARIVQRARKLGAKVLTISPGGEGNDALSDGRIRVRPGTDRFLAAAAVRALLDEDRLDPAAIQATANWPAFRERLLARDIDALLAACDVSFDDLGRLLEFARGPEPAAAIIGWGLQRHPFGGENVRHIDALWLLAGHVGKAGGGAYFNISSGRNLASWRIPGQDPPRRSLLLQDIGRQLPAADPPVRLAWIDGLNVVNQVPDPPAVSRALGACDFVVVVDAFLTETARCADLVLPCALQLESEDILGSCLHDYVNWSGRALDPPGEARPDFEIISELGRLLEPPVLLPDKETILRETLALPTLGVSLETLKERGWVRANRPRIAFEGLRFGHADGRFRLVERLSAEPDADQDYPLRLLSLIRKRAIHSQMDEAKQQGLLEAWVSPDNPALREANDGRTWLVSSLGRLEVRLAPDASLHPEVVLVRRGGWLSLGCNPNVLIACQETDMGHGTAYYGARVRIETA